MISGELQELAALHALGILRGEEAAVFERQCAENPELAALVQSLRDTADGLAFALPPVAPPAVLRERVLAGKMETPPANVNPFPQPTPAGRWQAIASLAALVAVTGLAVWFAVVAYRADIAAGIAEKKAVGLERERDTLVLDKDILTVNNDALTKARDAANTALDQTKKELADAAAISGKLQADLTMLKADKDKLLAEVAALQARGLYDKARIALMASTTKPVGKATAVSLWDQQAQGGVIVVQNLPALPAGRNYQLWVLDDGQPVSAGLLTLDGNGGGRIEFKPRKPITTPTLFAVTNETKGEQEAPDLKKLVLAGK